MENALRNAKLDPGCLLYVVNQKRNGTKLMRDVPSRPGVYCNPSPGTVVDTDVVSHSGNHNYFMVPAACPAACPPPARLAC